MASKSRDSEANGHHGWVTLAILTCELSRTFGALEHTETTPWIATGGLVLNCRVALEMLFWVSRSMLCAAGRLHPDADEASPSKQ